MCFHLTWLSIHVQVALYLGACGYVSTCMRIQMYPCARGHVVMCSLHGYKKKAEFYADFRTAGKFKKNAFEER
jgi:hypothetical protein